MNIYTRKKEIPSCIFETFTVELLTGKHKCMPYPNTDYKDVTNLNCISVF